MKNKISTDFLIIGGGIISLTLAKQLRERFPDKAILIIEKESDVGAHSSGRNSGVLHAGFYYTANSLKARFTRQGNAAMKQYCREKGLHLNECGKVVVVKDESELPALMELERRGKANGVDVKIVDESELKDIEPNAKTFQKALYSPATATVDPLEICLSLKSELLTSGVKILFSEGYVRNLGHNSIVTASGTVVEAGHIINAAGLYADKIAKDFGFSDKYVIIPFKGIYLKYSGSDHPVRVNIYPVPNLKNPFLGVHYTVTVDRHVKIGPTAIPAFWRENYSGMTNFSLSELFQVGAYEARLFISNAFGFRSLAFEEIRKYYKPYFVGLGKSLVKSISLNGFSEWTRPGIRAQLLNTKTLELVQDFVVEGDRNSTHILNAVSPAFTGSFPFTSWIIDTYIAAAVRRN